MKRIFLKVFEYIKSVIPFIVKNTVCMVCACRSVCCRYMCMHMCEDQRNPGLPGLPYFLLESLTELVAHGVPTPLG